MESAAGTSLGMVAETWTPESPFIAEPHVASESTSPLSPAVVFGPMEAAPSPFVAQYEDESGPDGAQGETLASVMAELYDPEFEEALTDLVHEASALAEDRFSFETDDVGALRTEQERGVRDYLEPLAAASEAALDGMIAGIGDKDLRPLSEAALEALLEPYLAQESGLPPTMEFFFKKILNKAKKAVKAVSKVTNVLMPHKLILGKLKGLVRPLLERVLKFAINKLPVNLRPIAEKLGKRLIGAATRGATKEFEDESSDAEGASADPVTLQEDFDAQLAGSIMRGESFDHEAAVELFLDEAGASGNADPLGRLEMERDVFARRIVALQPGEDAGPIVQNFVPAVMAALKIGLKIIGRPKVVNFLAQMVAKLISKYVGKQPATLLSRALVDTGLKLVGLEAAPELAAGRTLAATVEDTVTRVAETAPPEAWDNEALLEAYVFEAFEQAASAHFPDAMIRSELHEAAGGEGGAWIPAMGKRRRSRFKKYSRTITKTLDPQVTASVDSFGDSTLQQELYERLGVDPAQPAQATVQLFEAMAGATLDDIARHEASGDGSVGRAAWAQFHPLTPEAATALLGAPKLGKPVPPGFTSRRGPLAVGQRVYRVQVPGARVQMARRNIPGKTALVRPARTSRTLIDLDFPKGELRIMLYFSEVQAQKIAALFRRRAGASPLLTELKQGLEPRLRRILSGRPTRAVRIIHESSPLAQFVTPATGRVIRAARKGLRSAVLRAVLTALQSELSNGLARFAPAFISAADATADGVTVVLSFQRPAIMDPLRGLFRALSQAGLSAFDAAAPKGIGQSQVVIHPGYTRG